MQSSILDRRSLSHNPLSPSPDPRRLTICGFLPMPPISASPVCTPTTTMHTPASEITSSQSSAPDELLRALPTWIATPPTPPARGNVRRSVTLVRQQASSALSASASSPMPVAHASCNSVTARPRALSDTSVLTRAALLMDTCGSISPVFRLSSAESDLASEPDDAWDVEKAKDDIRKYHALMELLATEVSYLADLRVLVSIYLRNLSGLCRTSSTFVRNSRNNSYTHLPKTSSLSNQGLHPLTTLHAKPKATTQLFTDSEVDVLTRNAEEVLHLHEHFVEELRAAMMPLGFLVELSDTSSDEAEEKERIRNIDAAVGEVSTKFATEASRFDAYQSFCAGHPEALQLVHRAQHQYPAEWDAYEQKCASLIANIVEDSPSSRAESLRSPASSSEGEEQPLIVRSRKRTNSLASIDGAIRTLRSRPSSKERLSEVGKDKNSRRLAFMDYMIQPIQRICRYPLLLDQLRPGKALRALSPPAVRPHVNVVVESAAQAMRHVARAVDEARHRQDVAMQSSLIISRISLSNPSMAVSHMSSVYPAYQILTPSFLSSLGTCLLAGSLDVMHYQSRKPSSSGPNINAKYLGAFLYFGGYLILAKVSKGKVYEPKHWFSLADFEVLDLEEEDTSLPCTFSLMCKGHQLDLTAACLMEKEAWLASIHEASLHPPGWINEPTPSIHFDGKGELIPSALGGPFEATNALPTIQSLPELARDDIYPDLTESALAAFRSDVSQGQVLKAEIPSKSEPVASRRSSTASVKAIFSPSSDSGTIVIRRSSPAARTQVDQGLQDVVSEPILAARSHAVTRDELFQAPKILRTSSFARSNSALSLTGLTKNRLSRHESVRVPRKKSLADDGIQIQPMKHKSYGPRRRPKKLSIVSASEVESIFQPPSDPSISPFSQCSSVTSNLNSPTRDFRFPLVSDKEPHPPSTASSMRTRLASSPASPIASSSSPHSDHKTVTQGIWRRWTKGSLQHRRARSAPYDKNVPYDQNVPEIGPSPDNSGSSEHSPTLPDNFGAALTLTASPQEDPRVRTPPRPTPIARALSSDAPVTFRHSSAENTNRHKKSSIFKRLKAIDLGFT